MRWFWQNTAPPATYYEIRSANLSVVRPLYTADSVGGNPAVGNVRSGTVYGPSNELTGTCAVPGASSVLSGVAVDNTTGTATISAASIRSALGLASANLDTQLAAIPTTAAPTAAAIRTEIDSNSTKLANLDSRLTSTRAGYLDNLSTAPPSAATIATAVWATLTSALTTAGSIGKLLADNVNATISSAAADSSGVTTLLSRLTSVRASALDNLDATVSSRSTYAGGDTSGTTTLLGRLTSGRVANLDNLDASISSRLASSSYSAAPSAASIRAEIDANSTKLDATVSSRLAGSSYSAPLDAAGTRSAVGLATGNLDTQLSSLSSGISGLPSASAIASAVWAAATRTLTTAIDNSSTIAAAVWSYATGRTISGGTVDTLTNAPSVPSAAAIASQVRTELSTELGRIDTSVSSRLAPSGTLARVTLTDTATTLTNAPSVPSPQTVAAAVRTELTPELSRVSNCATTQEVDDIIEGALQ